MIQNLKYILTASLCVLFTNGFAQSVRYGAVVGISASKPKDFKTYVGYKVGAKGEISLSKKESGCYVDVGVLLVNKGWKSEIAYIGGSTDRADLSCSLYYAEIPVSIGYRYVPNERTKVFVKFGPYVDFGMFGSSELKGVDDESSDVSNVFSEGIYKRVDFGLNFSLGMELERHFQFMIAYDMGFKNPSEQWRLMTPKNRAFAINFAYMF